MTTTSLPNRGYFTIAQGEEYIRLAYALAISIKLSQPTINKLTIGVTKKEDVPVRYRWAFDQIVEIPWGDDAIAETWKLSNEWKAIFMSPYEETVKLDADMLFLTDIEAWWDVMATSELTYAKEVKTYRGIATTGDHYRKVFTENELPNFYSAFMYFKKTEKTHEFFKLAEFLFKNWDIAATKLLKIAHRPAIPTTDVVFAIAAKLLFVDEWRGTAQADIPTFIHMKPRLQGWEDKPENHSDVWTDIVPSYFTPTCKLMIGNHRVHLPFHYQHKAWLTAERLGYLEAMVNSQ